MGLHFKCVKEGDGEFPCNKIRHIRAAMGQKHNTANKLKSVVLKIAAKRWMENKEYSEGTDLNIMEPSKFKGMELISAE